MPEHVCLTVLILYVIELEEARLVRGIPIRVAQDALIGALIEQEEARFISLV